MHRSQSREFRYGGETASILAVIWTPLLQVRGRESPCPPEILSRVSIIETHYSRSIICGRSQRLIISSRPIDYSNVREIVLSSPFTVLSRRLRKDSTRARFNKKKKKSRCKELIRSNVSYKMHVDTYNCSRTYSHKELLFFCSFH